MASFEQERNHSSPFDAEELKSMLSGPRERAYAEESDDSRSKTRLGLLVIPCSLATNVLLFAFALFLLAHPCYFSARHCEYKRESHKNATEMANSGLTLMSEINGKVPECKFFAKFRE
jgi:hypothetical protein